MLVLIFVLYLLVFSYLFVSAHMLAVMFGHIRLYLIQQDLVCFERFCRYSSGFFLVSFFSVLLGFSYFAKKNHLCYFIICSFKLEINSTLPFFYLCFIYCLTACSLLTSCCFSRSCFLSLFCLAFLPG